MRVESALKKRHCEEERRSNLYLSNRLPRFARNDNEKFGLCAGDRNFLDLLVCSHRQQSSNNLNIFTKFRIETAGWKKVRGTIWPCAQEIGTFLKPPHYLAQICI